MTQPNRSTQAPAGSMRMTLSNISKGKVERPMRVLAYGVPGVGKSSFGAASPRPIFLASEDGTSHLDVERFPSPLAWQDVIDATDALLRDDHSYKTIVLDTLDWMEPLVWRHVAAMHRADSIDAIPFGRGFNEAVTVWRSLLARLDRLVSVRRMNVVMLAHAVIKRVDDPQTGPFDRYRIPLHEKSADVLREWVDALLFARHEVKTVERNGKTRGVSSGHRVLHTTWTAAYDAKNRFDLPEVLPLDWSEFEAACKAHVPADPGKLRAEIEGLLAQLGEEERAKGEKALREWAGDNAARLAQLLDKVRGKVAMAQQADGGES